MRVSRRRNRRTQLAEVSNKPVRPEIDIRSAEPNALKDAVQQALAALEPAEMEELRHEFVSRLEKAGFNVGGALFILGIPVRHEEDLTPLDLAQLVRYARMNLQNATSLLATPLAALLGSAQQSAPRAQPSKRAA